MEPSSVLSGSTAWKGGETCVRVTERLKDFEGFASARWLTLARMAFLLGADHHEAEDLAQVALTRCYVHWSKVAAASDQDAYAMRILVNEFARSRRRRWWQERPTDDLPERVENSADIDEIDTRDVIARALSHLAPGQREAVVLRHFAHMSEQQVAEALRVPVGTVKSRLSRAHRHLAANKELQALRNGQSS